MLKLARKLADCDQSLFDGWVIAGVNVWIKEDAVVYENNIVLHTARKSIIEVCGYNDSKQIVKSLRVILLNPSGDAASGKTVPCSGPLLFKHFFTKSEVCSYVNEVGDYNSIHQQELPIVPGMLMLAKLQQLLNLSELNWKVKFLCPVYAEQQVEFWLCNDYIDAYVDGILVFKIKK